MNKDGIVRPLLEALTMAETVKAGHLRWPSDT